MKIFENIDLPFGAIIDNDLILCWNNERRIITGADLLGRLLRGIAGRRPEFYTPKDE